MTDWLLGLVPQYGVFLLVTATFASCLAVPIPASLLMLAAGGFVASGDLSLTAVMGATLTGAVVGDQVGYIIGRLWGQRLIRLRGRAATSLHQANALLIRRGAMAVFLSRWLVSALGPYANLAAGMAPVGWITFTIWAIAGEGVWVTIYVGLGYLFTGNIAQATAAAGNLLGVLGAGAVAVGLGYWLLAVSRHGHGTDNGSGRAAKAPAARPSDGSVRRLPTGSDARSDP